MWKQLSPQYPRLSFIARSILASPAAGVGNERDFSIAGDIYNANQHFSPSTFSSIMVLNRYNYKSNENMYRHADLLTDETITEQELEEEVQQRRIILIKAIDNQYISDDEEEYIVRKYYPFI